MSMFKTDPGCIEQREYVNISAWHNAGYTGQGAVVFLDDKMDEPDHYECVEDIVQTIAPDARILIGSIDYTIDDGVVTRCIVSINGQKVDFDAFVQANNVRFINNSKARKSANKVNSPNAVYMKQKIREHNLIMTGAAGNNEGGAITSPYWGAAMLVNYVELVNGIPGPSYGSTGDGIDFTMFYGFRQGTSFAAPFLLGMCILLEQRHPGITQAEMYERLKGCCADLGDPGWDEENGWGLPVLPDPRGSELVETVNDVKDVLQEVLKDPRQIPHYALRDAWSWARENSVVVNDTPKAVSNREEVITMIMRSLEMKEMKGSGTRQDPYQIRTEEHLRAVVPGKYYEMMNDITLSGTRNNWTPIGAGRNGFTGQFDGRGHTIRNIQIDTDEDDQGFFGAIGSSGTGGAVKNLNIKDSSIKGKHKVGGIVGSAMYSFARITGCSFEGSVTASGGTAGGIAGYVRNASEIVECYNKGTVSGSENAGGIAGEASVSLVNDCHNEGDVYAGGFAGGIIGTNIVDMFQCLNTGNIFSMNTDTGSAGGIAGDERVESSSCVSAGSIVSSANADSAFRISPASSSRSNYALESTLVNGSTVSGTKDSVHGKDITAEQLASPEFYQTNLPYWDFDNTWMIDPVKGHPVLRWTYE